MNTMKQARKTILTALAEELDAEAQAHVERIHHLTEAAGEELIKLGVRGVKDQMPDVASEVLSTGEVPEWIAREIGWLK